MSAAEDVLKLYNQKEENEQKTSTVPSEDFKYKDKYEPSATAGILGLTAAGIGAVALKNPIARAINKTIRLQTPKLPAPTPSREVTDEVTSIIKSAPDKVQRGRDLVTMEQAKKIADENALLKAKSIELQKQVYQNPLQFGGNKKDGMGSALWDYIATGKGRSHKPRKAKDWIDELTSTAPGRHTSGNPDFQKINQSVKRDELWDSNLLQIDKDGRVVGGFLKYAADKNLELSKFDLLYIINKSPVNQLVTKRYATTPGFVDQVETLGSQIKNASANATQKLLSLQNNFADQPAKQELIKQAIDKMKNIDYSVNLKLARNDKNFRRGAVNEGELQGQTLKTFDEGELQILDDVDKTLRQAGINIGDDFTAGITRARQTDQTISRGHQFLRQDQPLPKYGGYSDYRVPGGLSYHEDVVYYPQKLPFGLRLPGNYTKHYENELDNIIYHTRYQMRHGANPNQKILSIDEIQSDYHQYINKIDPKRQKIVNPFGSEVEFFSSNRKLEELLAEMKKISDKGRAMTQEDRTRFYKIRDDFEEVKKNTLNLSNMVQRNLENAQDTNPFLPLYGKENWGMHAIKNTIKEAIKRGDTDWVVINPVERLHHAKRTRYLGDMEFYGNRAGKAGFKNYGRDDDVVKKVDDRDTPIEGNTDYKKEATIPNMMKKLAKQYNSEAKTIEVAKSDVTKPFKVVRDPGKTPDQWMLSKDARSEHIAAFRTKGEADAYAELNAGKVEFIEQGDPRLYYQAFGIRISPEMKTQPFKAYREGGLVVNIFA